MYTGRMPRAARALAVLSLASVAGAVAGWAPGQAAAAERQRVAVVKLAVEGGVSEAARDLFARQLVDGLAAAHFEVLAGATVRQKLAAAGVDLGNCRGGPCLARAARELDVAFLVVGSIDENDKTYDITLELVNGRSGAPIATNRERCEICGVEEAGEKVGLAASILGARLEALARTPAHFVIRSHPNGARVTIDGEAAGRTPLDRELPAGTHKLALTASGYEPLVRTVNAVNGVDEPPLELNLVPLPTKFPYRAAGWAALVVGVAALAAGIWAVHVDGSEVACADGERGLDMHCPTVRDTRALGAALVGVGGAAAMLGGTWIYFGGMGTPRNEQPEPATGVIVGGRF
jgi:hypothetical protein